MITAFDFLLAARQGELKGLLNLAATSALAGSISRLIHALQIERGFSNLHLGDFDPKFSANLDRLIQSSEAATVILRAHLEQMNLDSASHADRIRLLNRVALAIYLLDDHPRWRHKIKDRRISADESIQSFTHLINALLAVVFEAADTAIDPQITSLLVAWFNFMQAKELTGQERATGVMGFVHGYFDEALLRKMQFFQESQRRSLALFAEFAEPKLQTNWAALETATINHDINTLRLMAARTSPTACVHPGVAEIWYDFVSQRMDNMKTMEDTISARLTALCAEKIATARNDLTNQESLFKRLARLDEASPYPAARLFNVQAVELGSSPADAPGSQLGRSILDLLHTQTQRLQAMNDEIESAKHALNERKIIERAKTELMAQQKLSEEDAYRWMQQKSMGSGSKLTDVAKTILAARKT